MEKNIGAFEVRRQFGKILEAVVAKGDKFVVERHGEPVAAVVPIEIYNEWKRGREAFFDKIRAISERAHLTPEEAERVASQAVKTVRAKKRP
jgi:prevent-host-death family protein